MDTSDLRKQHADILEQIGVIRALLQMPDPKRLAHDLSERLDVLAATLALHLSHEDCHFYPAFLLSEDELIRSTAERFFVEMGHLRRAFNNYKDTWRTVREIQSNLNRFASETHTVFSQLENRIQRENTELFPLWEASPMGQQSLGNDTSSQIRKLA